MWWLMAHWGDVVAQLWDVVAQLANATGLHYSIDRGRSCPGFESGSLTVS
jgi:hypothetical protein